MRETSYSFLKKLGENSIGDGSEYAHTYTQTLMFKIQ